MSITSKLYNEIRNLEVVKSKGCRLGRSVRNLHYSTFIRIFSGLDSLQNQNVSQVTLTAYSLTSASCRPKCLNVSLPLIAAGPRLSPAEKLSLARPRHVARLDEGQDERMGARPRARRAPARGDNPQSVKYCNHIIIRHRVQAHSCSSILTENQPKSQCGLVLQRVLLLPEWQ